MEGDRGLEPRTR